VEKPIILLSTALYCFNLGGLVSGSGGIEAYHSSQLAFVSALMLLIESSGL